MPDSGSLAEIKVSELPVATAANTTDQIEANQAGVSRSITVAQIAALSPPPDLTDYVTDEELADAIAAVPIPPALTDVSPRSFGAVGDGITDDTAALQAAINAVSAAGGGNINCTGGRWLIDSATLIVKNGVFLIGPWKNLGIPQAANVNADYTQVKSAFIVNPAYTIKLNEKDCGIQGMAVLRKGLTTPTTVRQAYDLVQAFAGTGISISDSATRQGTDAYLGHLFVAGFAFGIASYSSRARLEYISGDNTNGIYITTSYDMQHLSHVHMFPFLTANTPPASYAVSGAVDNGSGLVRLSIASSVLVTGDRVTVTGVGGVSGASGPFIATVVNPTTVDLQGSTFGGAYTSGGTVYLSPWYRSGIAYNLDTAADWGQLDTCFSYNYAVGIRINASSEVTSVNCGTDSYAPANDTSTIGMLVTGACQATTLLGCKTSAQGVGLKCDTTATSRSTVHAVGHRSWGNLVYAYEVSNGRGTFTNCEASNNAVVRIDDAAFSSSFSNGDLPGVTFSYQSNNSPRPSLYNVAGQQSVNPVANAANGSVSVARFEGHMSAPAANDTIYNSYFLTDSSGSQIEILRESYRATAVTAGATASTLFWALRAAGVLTNVLQMSPTLLTPLVNNAMTLGAGAANWAGLFLGSGTAINWNNGAYTLTQSGATLTASGAFAGTTATFTGTASVGTNGASNNLTVKGTDNLNSFLVYGTTGTKFFYIKPETVTDVAQVGYFNGTTNVSLGIRGITLFYDGPPAVLSNTAVAAGSATQAFIKASTTANLGIYYGTGVPSFSAAKGSIYSCTNATTTTTRLYVNTDGAGTWATITTSA